MTGKKARLFSVEPHQAGCAVMCDGAALLTPAGAAYVVPTKALAEAIAGEWRAQGDKLKPETMPMTQLAATAIDITAVKMDRVRAALRAAAEGDMLCQRASEPPELVALQAEKWQPWLDWMQQTCGIFLRPGAGIMPVTQSPQELDRLQNHIAGWNAFLLTGLQEAAGLLGSVVLGMALSAQALSVQDLFNVAELESLFQMQRWGSDPLAEARHESLKRDLSNCLRWFQLLSA